MLSGAFAGGIQDAIGGVGEVPVERGHLVLFDCCLYGGEGGLLTGFGGRGVGEGEDILGEGEDGVFEELGFGHGGGGLVMCRVDREDG